MELLKDLEAAPLRIEEEESRHTKRLVAGVLFALLVTGAILGGYFYLRGRHEAQVADAAAVEAKDKAALLPQVEVVVDDAIIKDKETVLGGTVHNISKQPLSAVAVRLELHHRAGGSVETKTLPLDQPDLAPDGKGRYVISLIASEYNSARVAAIIAGSDHTSVPFRTLQGAQRPPEPPPVGKTILVKPPPRRGEEFINTPDNPGRIR